MKNILLPSLLSANFYDLKSDIEKLKEVGCTHLHVDVMDGMFVPNLAIGIPVIKSIDENSDMILDCHLMINEPGRYIKNFRDVGADIITIHTEASKNIEDDLKEIKSLGIKAGLSIKPKTDVEALYPFLNKGLVDMVLIMSVEPGFGGQGFIEDSYKKISDLKQYIKENNLIIDLEVDGGVCKDIILKVKNAGANMLVAGSAVFKNDIQNNFKVLNDIIKDE